MGRKRIWSSDAERMRAVRAKRGETGVARVEVQMNTAARDALAKLARQQRATPSEVVERLLLAAGAPAKRKKSVLEPDHPDLFT